MTDVTAAATAEQAYVRADGEGEALWFAGALMVVKAAREDTGGRFALLDQRVPAGYAAPLHVHHDEDEGWYVLEGAARFTCGERTFTASAGAWVFLPKGVPHTFSVDGAPARFLTLTAPAEFGEFVRAAGEPARALTVPPPGPADVARLAAIAAEHGIEIVGPPPAH